jgi:hypothetical protein
VINDGAKLCVLCDFHHQECTFLQTPVPRKRKLNGESVTGAEAQSMRSVSRASHFLHNEDLEPTSQFLRIKEEL